MAGIIRGRTLLARALTENGLVVEAQTECDQALRALTQYMCESDVGYQPLWARILRARGELLLRRGDLQAGFRELVVASEKYGQTGDFTTQAKVMAKLREVEGEHDYPKDSWPLNLERDRTRTRRRTEPTTQAEIDHPTDAAAAQHKVVPTQRLAQSE